METIGKHPRATVLMVSDEERKHFDVDALLLFGFVASVQEQQEVCNEKLYWTRHAIKLSTHLCCRMKDVVNRMDHQTADDADV